MATRLATQRTNLITVTPVTSQQASAATTTVQVVTETGEEISTGGSTNDQASTTTIIPASELAEATASIVKANNEDSVAATSTVATNALTLQQVIRQVCTKVFIIFQCLLLTFSYR